MKTITTNSHTLVVCEVPEKSIGFDLDTDPETGRQYFMYVDLNEAYQSELLPIGRYSILGTITKEGEVSFDCENLVMHVEYEEFGNKGSKYKLYFSYNSFGYQESSSEESFITLLESDGIYLNNPMGEKFRYDEGLPPYLNNQDKEAWKRYESQTVKKGTKLLTIKQEKP